MPTFQRPINDRTPPISCSFQCHKDRSSVNPGVDYAVATGTNVYAPEDGVVKLARWSDLVGWWIGLDFDNGWGADLLHNSKLLVKAGDRVKRGQHIAESGGTGSVATGPHVHWSLRPLKGSHLQNASNVNGERYVGSDPEEDDMSNAFLYHRRGTGNWWVRPLPEGKWKELTQTPNNLLKKAYGSPVELTVAESDELRKTYPNFTYPGGTTPVPPEPTPVPTSFRLEGDIEFNSTTGSGTIEADITAKEG